MRIISVTNRFVMIVCDVHFCLLNCYCCGALVRVHIISLNVELRLLTQTPVRYQCPRMYECELLSASELANHQNECSEKPSVDHIYIDEHCILVMNKR